MTEVSKKTLILVALVASAHAVCTPEMIAEITSKATTWTPVSSNHKFANLSREEFRSRLGSKDPSSQIPIRPKPLLEGDYPATFDAREAFGSCIHPIRD